MRFLLLFVLVLPTWAISNSVTIKDTSGSSQTNRPFTISRIFAKGEFIGDGAHYPQARVNGITLLTTQADVKNTWPDGSLKHVMISFVVPSISANSSVVVDFVSQSVSNTGSYATQSDILTAIGGTSQIVLGTSAGNADAYTMLSALTPSTDINTLGARYWLRGTICTQLILEDKTTALAYDFGTDFHKSLHPIFVLTLYPTTSLGIQVDYILENVWLSKWQNQSISITLTAGGSTAFTHATFTQIAGSRWDKKFWSGTAPTGWTSEAVPGVIIDYNLAYLSFSKAIANYDPAVVVPPTGTISVSTTVVNYNSQSAGIEPQFCVTASSFCGSYSKDLGAGGAWPYLGTIPLWFSQYLYTNSASLWPVLVGNAKASFSQAIHIRDDSNALFYDRAHTTTAFGRPISYVARPTLFPGPTCIASCSTNGWQSINPSHYPSFTYIPYLFTGEWIYWDELLMIYGSQLLGIDPDFDQSSRHRDWGWIGGTHQTRGVAWGLRDLAYSTFLAPDGTPEQTYLTQQLNGQFEIWEGYENITAGSFPPVNPACPGYNKNTSTIKWCWGRITASTRVGNGDVNSTITHNPSPIGDPEPSGNYGGQCCPGQSKDIYNSLTYGNNVQGDVSWMGGYLTNVLGAIYDFGYSDNFLLEKYEKWWIDMMFHNSPSSNWHIADYATPGSNSSQIYLASWSAWDAAFCTTFVANYCTQGAYNAQTDFANRLAQDQGYPKILRGALSYAIPYSSTYGTGTAAWTWILGQVTSANYPGDPEFSTLPRGSATSSVITGKIVISGNSVIR